MADRVVNFNGCIGNDGAGGVEHGATYRSGAAARLRVSLKTEGKKKNTRKVAESDLLLEACMIPPENRRKDQEKGSRQTIRACEQQKGDL